MTQNQQRSLQLLAWLAAAPPLGGGGSWVGELAAGEGIAEPPVAPATVIAAIVVAVLVIVGATLLVMMIRSRRSRSEPAGNGSMPASGGEARLNSSPFTTVDSDADAELRKLVEFVPGVLYSYDYSPDGQRRLKYLSSGFEELLGPQTAATIALRFDHLFQCIHPEDAPRLRAEAIEAARRMLPLNTEARLRTDEGVYRWVRSIGRPLRLPDGVIRWHVVLVDIQEQKKLEHEHQRIEQELRDSERQLRLVTDALPLLIGFVGRDERFQYANAAYHRWWGLSPDQIVGRTTEEILGPDIYEQAREQISKALLGETISYENKLVDSSGNLREVHIMYIPRINDAGVVLGYYVVVSDVTKMRQDESRRKMLMRELDHRVKNNLAAVLSLAQQMLAQSEMPREFASAFLGRIHAMARAHEALADAQWRGIEFSHAANLVLGPYIDEHSERVLLEGPEITLPGSMTMPLCLTLYELATNASKHGAFSTPQGTVLLRWSRTDESLTMEWLEQDGPPPPRERQQGTGMELIRGFIEFELRGSVTTEFLPEGLRCVMRLPMPHPSGRHRNVVLEDDSSHLALER